LNSAAEQLGVEKRRLYDITNVMEGIRVLDVDWSTPRGDSTNQFTLCFQASTT
jgi:hypothetical protein